MADTTDPKQNLQAVRMKLQSALVALGFATPCISVSVHDTDLDPLVGKAGGPVYIVGIGAAAPAETVNEALAQSEGGK